MNDELCHDFLSCETSVSQSENVQIDSPKGLKRTNLYLQGNLTAQNIVQNVFNYFQNFCNNRFPGLELNSIEETAKCTGLSYNTVIKYKNGPNENTMDKQKKPRRNISDNLHKSSEIRNVIYDMYSEKEPVTLNSVVLKLRQKNILDIGCTTLYHLLKKIGFKYQKDDNRRNLMEKPNIQHLRFLFLKKYMENEGKGPNKKPYLFLDETWIFQNGTARKSWQDDNPKSVRKITGDGSRYIVVHAGGEYGFIEDACLLFKSGRSTGDYHGEMDSDNFEKWLSECLLPKLEEPTIVILDNASYHSRIQDKAPTKSSKKEEMKEWLCNKNVDFPATATKDQLFALIKPFTKNKTFVVDKIIEEAGHEVLRLPPYHCHFNAIEMVWSQAKRYFDKHILKNKDVFGTWEQALKSVSTEQWAHYVEHTNKIIKSAWDKLRITREQQPLIINLDTSDEGSSTDSLDM